MANPLRHCYRNNNTLWINLDKGEHKVILKGLTPLLSKFTLPLPLKPNRVTVEKTGWEVVGLHENGWSDDQLQFSRIQQTRQDNTKPVLEPGVLPPFVRVERLLSLGLDWRVITQIIRISPADSAVVLTVPLLPGESVTSPGIRVKDNAVEVNMAAQQTRDAMGIHAGEIGQNRIDRTANGAMDRSLESGCQPYLAY